MKTLLKGGTVVSGSGIRPLDILIEGETIARVGENLETAGAEIMDVSGKLLFPGFIDAHTHFDLHVAGTVTADDFESGTRASLRGGTTTIIDYATQYKGETLEEGLQNWFAKAEGKANCDYGFHMSISEWTPDICDEIQRMMDEGVTSFKLYMTYNTQVDDKTIYQILRRLKEVGGITGVHCENSGVIAAMQEEAKAEGQMGVESHGKTRPAPTEAEAIDRLLRIAEIIDIPVIIVHLTCKEGLEVIEAARARGQKVYVETCPQYLLMNDEKYRLPGFEGAKYVCAPPLRKPEDQKALWKALAYDEIQTISTDHCSFTMDQKKLGIDDFTKIPGGMPGAETRAMLTYTYGVGEDKISLEQMCRLLSENPARLYGLYPRKGVIQEGSDADIVILNPQAGDVITAGDQEQKVDYAPFEGTKVKGRIEDVFLRGNHVVQNHQVMETHKGKFLERKTYSL